MLTSYRRCDSGRQFQRLDRGKPARITSPSLDCSSPETAPIQVERGRIPFSVPGDMYALWSSDDTTGNRFWKTLRELERDAPVRAVVPREGKFIPCHAWEIGTDLVSLPSLTDLSDSLANGPIDQKRTPAGCLVGLTNKGHVLRIGGLSHENSTQVLRCVSADVRLLNRGTQLPICTSGSGDCVFYLSQRSQRPNQVTASGNLGGDHARYPHKPRRLDNPQMSCARFPDLQVTASACISFIALGGTTGTTRGSSRLLSHNFRTILSPPSLWLTQLRCSHFLGGSPDAG